MRVPPQNINNYSKDNILVLYSKNNILVASLNNMKVYEMRIFEHYEKKNFQQNLSILAINILMNNINKIVIHIRLKT